MYIFGWTHTMTVPNFAAMRLGPLLLLILPIPMSAQMLVPDLLTELPAQLNETSGLLVLDDAIWTILDSGNPAAVYQIDPADGNVLRTVELLGASNVDYEEITADATWVYIGDFGNNAGARTNLRVYRIPRTALEDDAITQVAVDTIRFTFSDQVDFTIAYNANNHDCEAMVAMDDSLFLFTKRWLDGQTRMYALSAAPGDHVAQAREVFDTGGVVTSASWDGTDRLVLLGHVDDPGQPFIWFFNSVVGHEFFASGGIRRDLDMLDHQTEGIAWLTPDEWIISNESASGFPPQLWAVDAGWTATPAIACDHAPRFYPNPACNFLRVRGVEGRAAVRIVDHMGRVVMSSTLQQDAALDITTLVPGYYVALITSNGGRWSSPIVVAR